MGKAGRPPKIDRDVAVYLARWWRVNCLHESTSSADAWILCHWAEKTPHGDRVGITDAAHIRAAVRRCADTWLKDAEISLTDGIGLRDGPEPVVVLDPARAYFRRLTELPDQFEEDACVIAASEFVLHGRPKIWLWAPGMREVKRGRGVPVAELSVDVAGPAFSDRQGRTCIAAAVAEYVGLLRLRRLQRFHAPGPRPWRFGSGS